MRLVRTILMGCLLLVFACGSLLSLSGCGKDTGEGGVKIGGAQVDPAVEARDREAASTPPPAPAK
jgi:hypothetical protein